MAKVNPKDQSKQVPATEKFQEQLENLENRLKRAVADYQNLEKRFEKESSAVVRFANLSLIQRLLEVYDNLERAAASVKDQGVDMIARQFFTVLQEEGVQKLNPVGVDFDANTMECVEIVSGDKDKVIDVVTQGYILNDRVIRPAKVKVGSGDSN